MILFNILGQELGYPSIEGCDTPIIPYTDVAQNQVKNTVGTTEDNNNNQDTNTNDGEGAEKQQGRNQSH